MLLTPTVSVYRELAFVSGLQGGQMGPVSYRCTRDRPCCLRSPGRLQCPTHYVGGGGGALSPGVSEGSTRNRRKGEVGGQGLP